MITRGYRRGAGDAHVEWRGARDRKLTFGRRDNEKSLHWYFFPAFVALNWRARVACTCAPALGAL